QAVSDGWGKGILQQWFGLSDADFKNAEFAADYEKANYLEKIGMAYKKDPGEFMKNVGISMIPFYGTWKFKDENPGWLNAVSLALDLAIFIPFVGGVSALAKTGTGIGKALAKETLMTTRGLIVAPITTALHPIATTKAIFSPLGVLLSKVKMPSTIFWRGSGSQTMDIAKVLANPASVETTKAVDEALLLRNGGKASGSVPITVDGIEIGKIKWSDAGFQTVFNNSMGHSTPFGEPFTKGIMAKDEGLFLSPNMNLGLTSRSATGQCPVMSLITKLWLGRLAKTEGWLIAIIMLLARLQTTLERYQ
ncbi:serine/threonine protein phosphatase, partial [Dehalococcoides mccartyi]